MNTIILGHIFHHANIITLCNDAIPRVWPQIHNLFSIYLPIFRRCIYVTNDDESQYLVKSIINIPYR